MVANLSFQGEKKVKKKQWNDKEGRVRDEGLPGMIQYLW